MSHVKLSAVIITFNEEKNIARCIESVLAVADEIVVVDSYSADRTREICQKYHVRFFTHVFEGHVQQKNFAAELATFDYILSLDADEALSPTLTRSILNVKRQAVANAYSLNRLTNYCGSWIRHCGWYPDKRIRLWKKNIGYWGGENPHDKVIVGDRAIVAHLEGDLLHYSYGSISEHVKQIDKFTNISSLEAFKKNKHASRVIHLVFYPFFTFIKMYIFKLGVLDGVAGFLVCVSGSYYKFLKYAKLYHLQKDR